GKQLPVRADRVALRSGNDPHFSLERLIGDEVEDLASAGEVVDERWRAPIEGREVEIAVALVPLDDAEAHFRAVERGHRVAFLVGEAEQLAAVVERPRVVEALKRLGVPLVAAANDRAAVRAG